MTDHRRVARPRNKVTLAWVANDPRFTTLAIAALTAGAIVGAIVIREPLPRVAMILAALAGIGAFFALVTGRPVGTTTSALVSFGLAIFGLYLALPEDANESAPRLTSATAVQSDTAIEIGEIFQVRNVTQGGDFSDPVFAKEGDELAFRIRARNRINRPLTNVRVRIAHDVGGGRYSVTTATFASSTDGVVWPTDTATVNFSDADEYIEVDTRDATVRFRGNQKRSLPPGIDQAGISIGDLEEGAEAAIEFPATVKARAAPLGSGSVERGDILRGLNVTRRDKEFGDPVVASSGDEVLIMLRVHNGSFRPLTNLRVRAHVPRSRRSYATVTVSTFSDAAFPKTSSDTLIINFSHGSRLRLVPTFGSTELIEAYGHSERCPPQSRPRRIPDGILAGGIRVDFVGYRNPRDECSEVTVFVRFTVLVRA